MAGWPSAVQRHELGSFPGHAGPEDVKRFFELAPDDLRWALSHRGDARLGTGALLRSLRWLGFVPDALAELPQPALLASCEQLEADPTISSCTARGRRPAATTRGGPGSCRVPRVRSRAAGAV
ncbi:MAG TPA: DUF4158 domain-containing protein [Solirubrobacteraceae bacterium]|nr:DUF4158 domain-containing protein [Solirubrobacteraceae bacterium]